METWLKLGADSGSAAEADRQVRATVEQILGDIAVRGDDAVRELSMKFDKWDRDDYRLTGAEIEDCLSQLSRRDIEDIAFAQEQVRNFARHQRDALCDIEVETLPGVILGHRNIPINSAGCYVPGGKYPLLASAHMSVITARVAGVQGVMTCAPPCHGRPAPAIVAARQHGRRRRDLLPRRHPGGQRDGAGDAGYRLRRGGQAAVGPGRARPGQPGDPADHVGEAGARHHGADRAAAGNSADRADARQAWKKHGAVIVVESEAEMVQVADRLSSGRVQVMTRDPDHCLANMTNYGALFLGPRTNIAMIGRHASRPCALEGFVGHGEQANIRVRRHGGGNIPCGATAA